MILIKNSRSLGYGMLYFFLAAIWSGHVSAGTTKYDPSGSDIQMNSAHDPPGYHDWATEWGGYLKFIGSVSWIDAGTPFEPTNSEIYRDGALELRIHNQTYWSDACYTEIHYEVIGHGGDTHQRWVEMRNKSHSHSKSAGRVSGEVEDDRRLMDLTWPIEEAEAYRVYHRLDRLHLTLQPEWGSVSIGRQALTWGNGMLFNTMDLFNPISPTNIDREYKIGDDMVVVQVTTDRIHDLQLLCVPRRNLDTEALDWEQSSLGAKVHLAPTSTEFDLMAAMHYQDLIVGFGSMGYLGNAAWRSDATWTFLQHDDYETGFLALVANMDYAWIWWRKNFYGFIEFYYNGLGDLDYQDAWLDQNLSQRIARGEMFFLGKTYLSSEIQIEFHPLFNGHLTIIHNSADSSGILIPRVVGDIRQNVQITFGGQHYYGANGTEFGGFRIPQTDLHCMPSDNAFVWLTMFF